METIKQTLFTGWHLMRWVRLVFGIFFTIQGIQSSDTLMGVVGAFFLVTAITNTGCCGAGSCAAPTRKATRESTEEISYEEIKRK